MKKNLVTYALAAVAATVLLSACGGSAGGRPALLPVRIRMVPAARMNFMSTTGGNILMKK